MRHLERVFLLSLFLIFIAVPAWSAPTTPAQSGDQQQAGGNVLVGRISITDGQLLRYVPEQKDWEVTVKDAPFGLQDALYSGDDSKAEFLMPNSTWVRIGADTQVQMIALKPELTEIDVSAGTARFIDRSSGGVIEATTPYGNVVGQAGSAFDVYVGDQSVEVIAIEGQVQFIHEPDGTSYDVTPGSSSILADANQVSTGDGRVDAAWDEWNASRDTILADALEVKGDSVKYLPEGIQDNSRTLDENGRWERVYYHGEYRNVWRPVRVGDGWAPYTVGRWTDWDGDYTWIPDEPFGYVTSHYGYWFQTDNYWYWAPPLATVTVETPYLGIGFSWYPGRVGWLSAGASVGWFPLLPWEPYYANNWWGPSSYVARNVNITNININNYAFARRATVVNVNDFTRATNYARVRRRVAPNTIATRFRADPVARAALGKAAKDPRRFQFTNAKPSFRPNRNVTARVAQNRARFRQAAARANAAAVRQQVASAKPSKPLGARLPAPKVASVRRPGVTRQLVQNPRKPAAGPVQRVMTASREAAQKAPNVTAEARPGAPGATKPAVTAQAVPGHGNAPGKPGMAPRGAIPSPRGPGATAQARSVTPGPNQPRNQQAARAPRPGMTARGPSANAQARRATPTPGTTPGAPQRAARGAIPSPRGPSATAQARRAPTATAQGRQRIARAPGVGKQAGARRQTSAQARMQLSQRRGFRAPKAGAPRVAQAPHRAPSARVARAPRRAAAPRIARAPRRAPAARIARAPRRAPAPRVARAPRRAAAPRIARAPRMAPAPRAARAPRRAAAPRAAQAPRRAPAAHAARAPRAAPQRRASKRG